jgi:hypothetical protein
MRAREHGAHNPDYLFDREAVREHHRLCAAVAAEASNSSAWRRSGLGRRSGGMAGWTLIDGCHDSTRWGLKCAHWAKARPRVEGPALPQKPGARALKARWGTVGTLNARPPRARPARGATMILTFSPTASSSVASSKPVRAGGLAVDVDARLWPARGPRADARLRADARGCDNAVRGELAAAGAKKRWTGRLPT